MTRAIAIVGPDNGPSPAKHAAALALLAAMTVVPAAFSQMKTELPPAVPGAKPVAVERIRVHSAAIAGNLERESADRDVIVFLPPDYGHDTNRRYPVVYALHGFFIGAEVWTHEIHVPQTIEGAFARGSPPMAQADVLAKWSANEPLTFIDQYIDNLREYRAIAIDVGDQDDLRFDARKLHAILNRYGIKNDFNVYHGTHTSAVAYRFQDHVLPFFSRTLCFEDCD